MALTIITDDCTSCDACPEVCPNKAISVENSLYVIDAEKCTECVGAHDEPQCVSVCPADCIIPDPNHQETPEQLQEKYQRLHG